MSYLRLLEITSHSAAILTAVVAVAAYAHFNLLRLRRRKRLETYLKSEKESGDDRGQRSVLHLTARLGMTEAEIVDAAFRSKRIRRRVRSDGDGLADVLLLEYEDEPRS